MDELSSIIEKIQASEDLDFEDGMLLMESRNLSLIGALADYARKKTVGDRVMFISNCHINYTNICASKCRFCAYFRDREQKSAFTLTIDEIMEKAEKAWKMGATELHIVGSLNPELPFEYYEDVLSHLNEKYPAMSLKAYTAVEIAYLAGNSGMSIKEVLLRLKRAGLTSLPGGGGEIFNEETRKKICPDKISGEEWLEVMGTAHRLGIKSNATMLYGHIETHSDIVDHILRLRELQKRTGGFQAFIPLRFHPDNTDLQKTARIRYGPTGFDDLKITAISRLLLNGYINNIKAYWVMVGEKIAQIALHYGANDIDGTVMEERITHAAGGATPEYMPKDRLIHLIKSAGRIPVERTTNYEVIKEYN
ncbi:FO synthase subunit 2 [Candidatus Methanoperedens nitroreducens]|uniref:FO synthase subunit 2 n=1 Tax=Candidatus Methanoperedens nitratireducens TaxID=1392998 RepID=A0A062V9W6_9EURY|nr:aminofutalosine synthase MqnE [Candidatus Methanoperedens nitroreducens]KCZ72509.1 FO synthase subunit 2 [Candidatus Methanoperedens nitroreducens]MDJ1423557.1 aminofutalosine synthase MqnE [Candidatus Methanoperedens sp.]